MFTSLLILVATQTPPTLTYSNPGARTEVILADLSKQLGQPMRADESVRDIPLTIWLKEADQDIALAKIAEVEEAKWVNRGGINFLTADLKLKEKNRIAEANKRHQALLKQINTFIKEARNDKDPYRNAIADVILAIGPDQLADLDPTFRHVYSTNPAPLESALPELPIEDLRALAAGNQTPTQAVEANAPKLITDPDILDSLRIHLELDHQIADYDGLDNPISAITYTTDSSGKMRTTGDVGIYPKDSPSTDNPPAEAPKLKFPGQDEPDKVIELPPILVELKDDLEKRLEPSKEVRKRLLDPYNFPLSHFMGMLYVQWAEANQAQLIATFPDSASYLPMFLRRKVTSKILTEILDELPVKIEGNWVSILLQNALPSYLSSTQPLPDLLTRSQIYPTLVDTSTPSLKELILGHQVGIDQLELTFMPPIVYPNLMLSCFSAGDALPWLACLSSSELEALMSGKTIRLNNLSQTAKEPIIKKFFSVGSMMGLFMAGNNSSGPLEKDPFEAAPAPVPAEATVSMKQESFPAYRYTLASRPRVQRVVQDVGSLASAFSTRTEVPVEFGTYDHLVFHIHLCGQIEDDYFLDLFHFPPGSPALKPSEFTGDLKKQYDKALEAAKEVQRRRLHQSNGNP